MSVQQPRTQQLEGEADSYPDPKRSWGRSGSLLGTWGVLLLAVYFAGWVFDGLVDKSPESSLDEPTTTANQTALRVLNFTYLERDPGKAADLQCDDHSGLTTKQLFSKLTTWEDDAGVLGDPTVGFKDGGESGSKDGDATLFPMFVEIENEVSFVTWEFDVNIKPDGDTFCVSKIVDVTKSDLGSRCSILEALGVSTRCSIIGRAFGHGALGSCE